MVLNPAESPVRKLAYEFFLKHRRKKRVARLLNEAGYRTRKGAKFTGLSIERLLQDPTAKGVHRANYTTRVNEKKWTEKPQEDWVLNRVEPIISEELWEQCNEILDEQQKSHKPASRKAIHLFTGFAYCHCGNIMYVPSNAPKYICYKCRNKISMTDLEEIFHHQLKSFLFSPKEISKYLEETDNVIKEKQELLTSLTEEKVKTQKEMDKTYKLYIDDQISKAGFGKRYKPMEERYKQIDEQIPLLEGQIDYLKSQHLSKDEVLHEARDLHSRWPKLEREEKRQIIETITEKIIVGQKDITINLCYLPSPSEMMAERERSRRDSNPRCP